MSGLVLNSLIYCPHSRDVTVKYHCSVTLIREKSLKMHQKLPQNLLGPRILPWTGGVCGYFILHSVASRTFSSLWACLKYAKDPDECEYFPSHQATRRQQLPNTSLWGEGLDPQTCKSEQSHCLQLKKCVLICKLSTMRQQISAFQDTFWSWCFLYHQSWVILAFYKYLKTNTEMKRAIYNLKGGMHPKLEVQKWRYICQDHSSKCMWIIAVRVNH